MDAASRDIRVPEAAHPKPLTRRVLRTCSLACVAEIPEGILRDAVKRLGIRDKTLQGGNRDQDSKARSSFIFGSAVLCRNGICSNRPRSAEWQPRYGRNHH